jgi:hypothetical protein
MNDHRQDSGSARRHRLRADRVDGSRRRVLAAGAVLAAATFSLPALAQWGLSIERNGKTFARVRTQFIAALAAPDAQSGHNAQLWGLWRRDPGPRGVRLDDFDRLLAAHGVAPAQWQFDRADWWLEEHGLIMEQPEFPLPPGDYLVTGNRRVTTVLTVGERAADRTQAWALADGAAIYDVTHLRCRSARYTPAAADGDCAPSTARADEFPVEPGAAMPPVDGCHKQDYAVLFVIGVAPAGA